MQLLALPTAPDDVRQLIRSGRSESSRPAESRLDTSRQTSRFCPEHLAFDFLLFCQRNPKPCPLLEVVEAGDVEPIQFAPGADLRTDVPLYRIYEYGEMTAEVEDISEFWRDDLVSFLLGCSFSFESALTRAGIPLRHIERETNVSMFITDIPATSAGVFNGPTVVSMRPIRQEQVVRAVQVTSRFPAVHGAPLHVGDPTAIGIDDIMQPDFGDPTEIRSGEIPVFWACGVTPQAAAMASRPPMMITHSPGYMFITDKKDEDLAVL